MYGRNCFCDSAASRDTIRNNGCKDFLDRCTYTDGTTQAQCKILYDAAVKAGGQWGLPDARAASHTTGKSYQCRPDE